MSRTLVELCQTASQISRVAFLTGHLLQTSGHLAERLCPAGCGIRHQRDGISHVAEIFRDRDTGIDRSLTCRNRHIRCVGDQHGPLHQGLSRLRVSQLRELVQNVRHLISTLSASDIDDDIRLCPFCKLMLDHSLSASERSGHCSNTAFCDREERIDHALSCHQRHLRRKFLLIRASAAHRPLLHECELFVAIFCSHHCHNLFHRKLTGFDLFYRSPDPVGNHDLLLHQHRLLDSTDNVALLYFIARLDCGNKLPLQVTLQGRNFHAAL